MFPWEAAFVTPWLVFGAWWAVRARGNARALQRESRASRLRYGILFIAGALLLALGERISTAQLWQPSRSLAACLLALEWAGVGFTIWAREHLGRMWSGAVTLKEDHRIICTGPYRIVRHPIYTGILTGLVAVALVRGLVAALVALPLFVIGFWRKLRLEERVLVEHFGESYRTYQREVSALIPYLL
jgi:protein-S-isoprenylcysteine O-methyltransferase Ste14